MRAVKPAGSSEWWEDFFDATVLEMWRSAIPAEHTRAEADFIAGVLGLEPGARVLDAPCGEGRLSRELASRGFRVTGVDISASFLKEAELKAAELGLDIRFERRDVRRLDGQPEFDGAFCFGNSFGYFTDQGNASFLTSLNQVLKPGARLALDASSVAETILPRFEKSTETPIGDVRFLEENNYDHIQGRYDTRYTFVMPGGRRVTKWGSHRIYTYREMVGMLEAAGFNRVEGFASTRREPFALGASQLFLVAAKRLAAKGPKQSQND